MRRLPFCHSRRGDKADESRFCAHPRFHASNNVVSASICRACALDSEDPPPRLRNYPFEPERIVARGHIQIVVAKYHENVDWLNRFRGFDQIVYDKGDASAPHPLPNIGREAHTYLHHIISHYDRLADITVFLQGDPHFHCANLDERICSLSASSDFVEFGDSILVEDHTGQPIHPGLPLAETYQSLFDAESPEYFVCHAAACFAVSAKRIRQRPRSFYEKMLGLVLEDERGPYWAERLWQFVFAGPAITEGIITAADARFFSDLQFLIRSIRDSGNDYPIAVYDLGLYPEQSQWTRSVDYVDVMPMPSTVHSVERLQRFEWWQTWLKPFYFFNCSFDRAIWIDADCTVLADLADAFRLVSMRPLLVRDITSVRTENDPRLYRHLALPENANVVGTCVNAGVVGLEKTRDADLLNAWAYGVDWIGRHPEKQSLVSWVDQGMLLWAIHKNGITDVIDSNVTWNQPSSVQHGLLAAAVQAGHSVLKEIRSRFPQSGIVHWLGDHKLSRQIETEFDWLFCRH